MVRYILLIFLQGMGALVLAQGGISFEPVQASGLPYTILVRNVDWNGEECPAGTLIGAFSDTLCVGVSEYQTGGNIQLITWAGDPSQQLPGFTPGDSMQFYALIPYAGDWHICKAEMQVIEGNGCFGWGAYSALDLSIADSSFIVGSAEVHSDLPLTVYPNPFVDQIHVSAGGKRINQIEIYNTGGQLLQSISARSDLSCSINLSYYSNGLYFLKIEIETNGQMVPNRPVCLSIQKISVD